MIDDTRASEITEHDPEIDETQRLISSRKVEGTHVYNLEGEHIGSVDSFMVDKLSGQVSYAVMSFGGFLGIGERYHALPWDALTFDTSAGGYVVNITREQLEGGPSFAHGDDPWTDPEYGRLIHSHYGLPYRM
ncbi:PRC-barrel domain-containing protein [Natronohydrobacter thiooxidans]|jgi:sporulation protein YlmC with PRC-barrel domain|uniref:PRC-barrel domain-containing protein n=1 Tax=Natronohydrobacter thiooxidans TaxID=87172 RepID=UPI0008FF499C|nr:PRC-barrel domain-containing protein [Natronohydrobacter thiooxidans]